jgi:hydrogenase nickel incorporation protein HypA/HybF
MHELAICQSLLSEAGRLAALNSAREVTGIVVAIGPLSGVEPQLLGRAFSIARAGTLAERASLTIETAPVLVWCKACEIETQVEVNALLCGACGTWQVQLKSGNEMLLKRLELADVADAAAAE